MNKTCELTCRLKPKLLFIHSFHLLLIAQLIISIVNVQQLAYAKLRLPQQELNRKDAQTVEPGKSVERELAGGQRHAYLLAVSAGRYLRLTVYQLGVDVVLTVYKGNGQSLIEVDKANGTRGRETVSLVSDTTGEYYLRVGAREEKATAGRYTLEISEARPASSEDEVRWSAEQRFAEAKYSVRQRTKAGQAHAIEKYREALRLWRTINDTEGEATALLNLAHADYRAAEYQQALSTYEDALKLFQFVNDPFSQALTILYMGMCKVALGDNETALSLYTQAEKLFADLDDQKYLALALNEIGRVYYLQGDGPQSRSYYLRALEIRKRIDDRKGIAFSLNVLGRTLFYALGEEEQALGYYKQALEIQQASGDRLGEPQTLDDIGRIHFSSGRYQEALEHYNRALKLQRYSGDTVGEAETLSYIGMVYAATGRYQDALNDYYRVALKIQQDKRDSTGEGHTLHNMGMAYFLSGNYEEALSHFKAALGIWKDNLRTAEAETRYGIAKVEQRRGNLSEARRQLEAALPIIESLRTKIANQYLRISYFASVQKYYELYVDVLMQMHEKSPADGLDKMALGVNERARARALLDTLIESRVDIRRGVDLDLLRREQSLQQQLTALSQQRMLADDKNPERAAGEKNRLAALLMEYQKVEEQILQKSPGYSALTQPVTLSLEDIQTKLLDRDTVLLEYALGDERSYLWVVTQTSINHYTLPKRVDIENTAKHLRELLTTRNKVIKGERDEQQLARAERADADALRAAAALSEMLSLGKATARFEAKRLVIVGDGELQYVPFALLTVPQRSERKTATVGRAPGMINDSVPLINYYEVVMDPSISLLAELRRQQPVLTKNASRKAVIVLADPVFDRNDERVKKARAAYAAKKSEDRTGSSSAVSSSSTGSASSADTAANVRDAYGSIARLPFTRREAKDIADLLPSSSMKVLDFDASRATVNSGILTQYHIVHFATHGFTNDEHPELSGILLSMVDEEGKPQDGFLHCRLCRSSLTKSKLAAMRRADECWAAKVLPVEGMFSPSEVFIICAKVTGFLHFMRGFFLTI